MKVSEVANRYAKAAYELAVDNRTQDKVFADLRALEQAFSKDREILEFLSSPLVPQENRVQALMKALDGKGLANEARDLVLLLARKDRMAIFSEVVLAFEGQSDAANNVARGEVRSAAALGPDDRKKIEERVESVLKKKVILSYRVDSSVIGGLVAQVGSYTFDDSIDAHLRRMNEELKRRTV